MTRVPRSTALGHFGWPDDTPEYPLQSTSPTSVLRRFTPQITPFVLCLGSTVAETRRVLCHDRLVLAATSKPTGTQPEDPFALAVTIRGRQRREAASETTLTVAGHAAHGDLKSELVDVSDHESCPAPWESCGLNANRPPRRAANLPVRNVPGQSVSIRYEQTQPRVARLAGLTFHPRELVPAVCERPISERRSSEMVLRTCGLGHAWPETASPVSRTPHVCRSVAVFR